MDQADRDAIRILATLVESEPWDTCILDAGSALGVGILRRSIMHLAYPDRARYPKTRRGTKRHPVELSYGNRPDPR